MEHAKLFGVLIIISVLLFFAHNAWKPVPDKTVSRKNLKNISKDDTVANTKPAAVEKDNRRNVDGPIPPVSEMPKELPKEEKPKFRPAYFESTGRKYVGTNGMGCDDASQLATMTDASIEACEAMCAADSQCGAFTLDSGRLCTTYMICYTKKAPKETNLFIRE